MLGFNNVFLAYADPGSGALILQLLMAAAFGGLFYFRRIRDRVFGIFRKRPPDKVEVGSSQANSTESVD